jgi:hypothetical protein
LQYAIGHEICSSRKKQQTTGDAVVAGTAVQTETADRNQASSLSLKPHKQHRECRRKLSTLLLAQQRARQSNAAASKTCTEDLQYAIGHEICSSRKEQQTTGDAVHASGLGLHSEEREQEGQHEGIK